MAEHRRGLVLALFAVAGCGRAHFDARRDATSGDAITGDALVIDMQPDSFVDPIGCSDGSREGFADAMAFPGIAACTASWAGTPGMRDAPTGASCGGSTPCTVPADACAPGWHVCGSSGDPVDLSSRITGSQCQVAGGAATGAFVAALGHCDTCGNGCTVPADCSYTATYGCPAVLIVCGEPVCCGVECSNQATCASGAFPGATRISASNVPCGAMTGNTQSGVLCCRG